MSGNSVERNWMKACAGSNSSRGSDRRLKQEPDAEARIPAVVVSSRGAGAMGVVRSLSQANIPVIVVGEHGFAPAMYTRFARSVVISRASGVPLVKDLLALAATIAGPAVLFVTSDDAALTVSECRAELQNSYRFLLPSHDCLTSLIHKTSFQKLAEVHGFPIPHSVRIEHIADLGRLAELRFPCIVKPTRGTAKYFKRQFAKGYKVSTREEAEATCRNILTVLPDLVVQEWVEGGVGDIYFCLQYRATDGATLCSFTGRKLSIFPPDVGPAASCTAAPEAHPVLHSLTEAFFDRMSYVGLGSMEFKRDARTGRFVMIEPTVGRVDANEEVATIHGVNIPLVAYLCETGLPAPPVQPNPIPVVWRDGWSHWRSARGGRTPEAGMPGARVYGAYWRLNDPMPALVHLLDGFMRQLRRALRLAAPRT